MAFGNPFAILDDDDDGTGVAALVDRIAKKQKKPASKSANGNGGGEKSAAEKKKSVPKSVNGNGNAGGRGSEDKGRGDSSGGRAGSGGRGEQSGNGKPAYKDAGQRQRTGNGSENGTDQNQEKGNKSNVNNGGGDYGRARGDFSNNNGTGRIGRDGRRSNGASDRGSPVKALSAAERKQEVENERKARERTQKEWEEDAVKLTLDQYEAKRLQIRRAFEAKLKNPAGGPKTSASHGLSTEDRRAEFARKLESEVSGKKVVEMKKAEESSFIKLQKKAEKEKRPKRKDSVRKAGEIACKPIILNFQYRKHEGETEHAHPAPSRACTSGLSVSARKA